ncbi:MAG: serine hydrolase [Terrimicrobiaceae bacterium]|nr:serine hydrolase [Terrimicrobiaceae bacterium]
MRSSLRALPFLFVAIAPLRAMEPAAALRLPDARIASAAGYSRKCGGQALVVLQAGRTLHESYANGGSPDRAFWIMSITKNLAALAILAARSEGLLDLDEPVAKTIPEWRGRARQERIAIRELLNQTSGLVTGFDSIYARGVRDKNKLAIALPLAAEPGACFDYGPGNYELIEEILRRKLLPRRTDPLAYLTAKILTPLGVHPADWRRDRRGNPFFSAGAKLTARDLAKIGEFIRVQGRAWIVPLLPPAAFSGAFAGSAANSMYGLSFWLNANVTRAGADPISIEGALGRCRPPEEWRRSSISNVSPADLIALVGSGGERCYIVPSRKIVVVRYGRGSNFSDAEFLRRLFDGR